ncbi:MAG: VCBS repeat-containing protein [Myxococcales bacterium]|nr:VCBS repeat-containing protein [Myxococcales bacterium]
MLDSQGHRIADFDGDGVGDMVATVLSPRQIRVYTTDTIVFTPIPASSGVDSVEAMHIDGDGHTDLVVSGQFYANVGDGSFIPFAVLGTEHVQGRLSRGHFNPVPDARDDLLVLEDDGALWAWVADQGSYVPSLLAEDVTSVAVGDYWSEGSDRVVLRTADGTSSKRFVQSWQPAEPLPVELGPGTLIGGRELLTAYSDSSLVSWRNINQLEYVQLPNSEMKLLILDADGDGDEDMLAVESSGSSSIILFAGPEAWECWAPVDGFHPTVPGHFVAGDLDGSGGDEFLYKFYHTLGRQRLTYP